MFTIYDCYLDDSKDRCQEFTYVCAGFFGTEEVWKIFGKAWRRQLKAEGIVYFKSSECNSLTGQFEKWRNLPRPHGHRAAQQIKQRLARIAIGFRGLHGVGVALPVGEHEAVLKHENASRVFPEQYMYHRSFELAILDATRVACVNPKDLMVFVHDDGQDFAQLLTIFNDFKMKNPKTGKHLSAFLKMDDKKTPALQLADMFANSVQGLTLGFLTGKEKIPDDFIFDRSGLKVWTRELGEKVLALNFKSRGIAIPQSLEDAIASHPPGPVRSRSKLRT
jgi:hypothetical protein